MPQRAGNGMPSADVFRGRCKDYNRPASDSSSSATWQNVPLMMATDWLLGIQHSNRRFQISEFSIRRASSTLCFLAVVNGALIAAADEPRAVAVTEALPFGQPPVDYWSKAPDDTVAELQRRLDAKELELPFVEKFGYLPAMLKELDIPIESQLLAFSSQSPHRSQIRPERPRAVYFNEDVSVSWFPGAVLLEIAAHDSRKGTLFYTVVNREETRPEFYRSNSQTCLGCHHMPANPSWTGVAVPGHLLRTFLEVEGRGLRVEGQTGTDSDSQPSTFNPQPFRKIRSHTLPLEDRWQTWYVTGITPDQRHRGNLSLAEHQRLKNEDPHYYRTIADLAVDFDTDRYPTNTSDVVAHLIFDHQMLGLNLLARLSYEHQFGVRSDIEDMVVRYLLMVDEAPLHKPVAGTSDYAERYRRRDSKTADAPSLHDLDLQTRLFQHRISPLVNCRMVRSFPSALKQRLFTRLSRVLTGQDEVDGYSISATDRRSTLAVLKSTVEDWPQD